MRTLPCPDRSSPRLLCDRLLGSRAGATLTEVLMSLLIMSVGILSVMSLFPIALLRTITSAQRTTATLLNDNAVAEMTAQNALLSPAPPWEPDSTYFQGSLVTPSPSAGGRIGMTNRLFMNVTGGGIAAAFANTAPLSSPVEPDWSETLPTPGTTVNNGQRLDVNVGGQTSGNFTGLAFGQDNGASGRVLPAWDEIFLDNPTNPFQGPTIVTTAAYPGEQLTRQRATVYAIDPYGWAARAYDNFPTSTVDLSVGDPNSPNSDAGGFGPTNDWNFGVGKIDDGGTITTWYPGIVRLDAGLRNDATVMNYKANATDPDATRSARLAVANQRVGLQDTLDEVVRLDGDLASRLSVTTTSGETTIAPGNLKSDALDIALVRDFIGQPLRVVTTNGVGTRTETRIVNVVDGSPPASNFIDIDGANQITISDLTPQLLDTTLSRVSLETYDPQFTFMVTVRQEAGGVTRRSVVVFFNRQLDVETERPYRASFGFGYDENDDDDVADANDVALDNTTILVLWDADTTNGRQQTRPILKPGGWVFDPTGGHWYQVERITEPVPTGGGGTLDDAAVLHVRGQLQRVDSSPQEPVARTIASGAILMPGVVRVYEQGLGR